MNSKSNSTKEKYSNIQFIKDLWHFFRKFKGKFIFYTILLIFAYAIDLVPPLILAKIIDFFGTDYTSMKPFYTLLLILLGLSILATITRHISKYSLAVFNNKVQKHAKIETFQKMINNDLVWHEGQNTGEKIEKINEGKKAIGNFMSFYINQGLPIIVSFVGIITIFSLFSLKYSVITAIYIAIYLFFEHKMNKITGKKSLKARIAREAAAGKSFEFSSNMSTVKSLGLEKQAVDQIGMAEDLVFTKRIARRLADGKKWAVVSLISVVFYSIYLFFIGRDVFAGALTIGSILIYVEYIRRIQRAVLGNVSSQALKLIDMKHGLERMMEIYHTLPEIDEYKAKKIFSWNKISFNNVSFSYDRKQVLDNFNLEINKGEKIGIVSSSGGGKSTFFKLLLKLYLPKSGKILFDKKNNLSIKRESILSKISIVPQETELFDLNLKENIKISKPGRFDSKKYKEALKKSQLDTFVSKLQLRDLTMIGEKGTKLSGGERQRLGIARAIYKDSDIIILDEATSNLDYETEKRFQKAIDSIKEKTMIVAAHRLSTLQNMDKILFMEKGKIVEEGTYIKLINKKGKFYKLWKAQKH
jgi:ABC-type multidrug transport system fused ATPase/permease subunit